MVQIGPVTLYEILIEYLGSYRASLKTASARAGVHVCLFHRVTVIHPF